MGQKVIIQLIEIRTLVDKGVGFDFGNLLGSDQPEGFRYKELFGAVFIAGGLIGVGAFVYAVTLTK